MFDDDGLCPFEFSLRKKDKQMTVVIIIVVIFAGLIITSIILGRRVKGNLCASLNRLGLNAQITERGRPEEHIGENWKGKSQGLIEIEGSLIRWVNVLKQEGTGGEHGSPDTYTNVYLIPSSTVYVEAYYEMQSIRVKSVPLFGEVVDIRWKTDLEGDLIQRINGDVTLKESLIKLNEDVTIRSFPNDGCWAIVSRRYHGWFGPQKQRAPSRAQWECYKTIARHLLEAS